MKKILSLMLVMVLVLSGCSPKSNDDLSTTEQSNIETIEVSSSLDLSNVNSKLLLGFGNTESVEDNVTVLEPMYNVPKNLKLKLSTNIKGQMINPFLQLMVEESEEYISVYTDREMTDSVLTSIDYDSETGELTIYPLPGTTGRYGREGIEKEGDWGSLKTYYLVIRVDLTKDSITLLDKPQRMMFTIESHIDSPTVKMSQREDGNFKLVWDEVKGADGYKVYAGMGHKMELLGDVTTREFILTNEEYIESSMNTLLEDIYSYTVVAYNTEGEGLAGNLIKGEDYSAMAPTSFALLDENYYNEYMSTNPKVKFESEASFGSHFQKSTYWSKDSESDEGIDIISDINELPTHVKLYTKKYVGSDGEYGFKWNTQDYSVVWDLRNPIYSNDDTEKWSAKYTGYVLGTSSKLSYIHKNSKYVDGTKIDTHLTEEQISAFEKNRGNAIPNVIAENLEDKIEVKNTPTNDEVAAIEQEKPSKELEVVNETPQLDVTEKTTSPVEEQIVEEKVEIEIEDSGEKIELDMNNLETVIALGMLNYETEINLSKFSKEVSDGTYLSEVLSKVMAQYPLIIGELEMSYDYTTDNLLVTYDISKEDGQALQEAVLVKAKEIVSKTITSDMSDLDKYKALHDYLIDTVTYDQRALDAFMKGMSNEDLLKEYGKSFNVSGAILDGYGVCQSYAEAYKLLSDLSNLKTIVVYGDLQNVPHAWNKIYLNDGWYHVDATNNDNGIPYPIYKTSDNLLPSLWSEDDSYTIKSEYKLYRGTNNSHDYYVENGLYASNKSELITLLKGLTSVEQTYIKLPKEISEKDIIAALKEGLGSKASEYDNIGMTLGLLVLIVE